MVKAYIYRIRKLEYCLISKDRRGYLVAQDFLYEDVQKNNGEENIRLLFHIFFQFKGVNLTLMSCRYCHHPMNSEYQI